MWQGVSFCVVVGGAGGGGGGGEFKHCKKKVGIEMERDKNLVFI